MRVVVQKESGETLEQLRASLKGGNKSSVQKKSNMFQTMFSNFGGGQDGQAATSPSPEEDQVKPARPTTQASSSGTEAISRMRSGSDGSFAVESSTQPPVTKESVRRVVAPPTVPPVPTQAKIISARLSQDTNGSASRAGGVTVDGCIVTMRSPSPQAVRRSAARSSSIESLPEAKDDTVVSIAAAAPQPRRVTPPIVPIVPVDPSVYSIDSHGDDTPVPNDALNSVFRQILREKARSDVLHDAVCQPRMPLPDVMWQWIRGRFGLKSLALEMRRRFMSAASAHKLVAPLLERSSPAASIDVIATLFHQLHECDGNVTSNTCFTVMNTLLRRRFDLGLRLQNDVMLSQPECDAILQDALSKIQCETRIPWEPVIDKVIAAAVVQGRANRPNKNTVNGEVWCSEDGLVLALFDTLKRLVDRNPGMSCPAVSPNDRIADVDFFDVLQAVDASIEASQRVEMFAANVQEGRNTISRLRLGHYLRKTGLLSSRGFPKASEQRAGPYRSTDADDTVQLKFALECVQGGLDAALSGIQVRASAGTMEPTIDWSSDIAMIARIQSRMKQLIAEGCNGTIAWELYRTVMTAVDALQNGVSGASSGDPWFVKAAPHSSPRQDSDVKASGDDVRKPSKTTNGGGRRSTSGKHRRHKSRSQHHKGRKVEEINFRVPNFKDPGLLPTYKLRTRKELQAAVKTWERAARKLSRSPLPKRVLSPSDKEAMQQRRIKYLQARIGALETAETMSPLPVQRSLYTRPTASEQLRSLMLRSGSSVELIQRGRRSLSPSRGRSSPTRLYEGIAPLHLSSLSPRHRSASSGTRRRRKRRSRSPRIARFPGSTTLSTLLTAPEPSSILSTLPPPVSGDVDWAPGQPSRVMFSADELNLLESIANSEVKSLESCAALKKSLHPTPKVVPPSPPARPVVAPTHCVAEENPSSPSTLRSVSKSPDRDVQSDTSPVNKGALVEKRATMFSQLVDSIFDEVSDVE